MKTCLVSGSFDPITLGHLDIIEKACNMCDKVIVGVFNNEEKTYLFDLKTREKLCKIAVKTMPKVQVSCSNGMVSDFCKENDVDCIIRGFRDEVDYNYETQMAKYNFEHCGVKTLLMSAKNALENVSSSKVRELLKNNDALIEKFVPIEVLEEVRREYNE